jgi:hypothetical protein
MLSFGLQLFDTFVLCDNNHGLIVHMDQNYELPVHTFKFHGWDSWFGSNNFN